MVIAAVLDAESQRTKSHPVDQFGAAPPISVVDEYGWNLGVVCTTAKPNLSYPGEIENTMVQTVEIPDSEEVFMLEQAMKYPEWQKPYRAALVEMNQEELGKKIAVAEAAALSLRARELTTNSWDIDEHFAVRDAAFNLRLLKSQSAKG